MKKGVYQYFLNGEPTGVSETFNIVIRPDGSKTTTSIRDATPFKTIITVKATEKDNKFQNCEINFQKDEINAEAQYQFSEKTFHVLRKLNGKTVQAETLDLPETVIFFPLMRCFQGETILHVSKNKDFTTVIVPDIQPSTDFQNLLQPTFDERTAEWIGLGTIKLNDKLTDAKIYKYLSKHYDEKSEFWITATGFLFSYEFYQSDNQTWSVYLNQT